MNPITKIRKERRKEFEKLAYPVVHSELVEDTKALNILQFFNSDTEDMIIKEIVRFIEKNWNIHLGGNRIISADELLIFLKETKGK